MGMEAESAEQVVVSGGDVQRAVVRESRARGDARWWSWWSPLASRLDFVDASVHAAWSWAVGVQVLGLSAAARLKGRVLWRDHLARRAQATASVKPWGADWRDRVCSR